MECGERLVRGGPGPRIVGGTLKGFRLRTARRLKVRPASSRLRQVLFDLLRLEVSGASVLDLFAGLGTVGLEALSRGAVRAVFVEREGELCALLTTNVRRAGYQSRSDVLCLDADRALGALDRRAERFSLVFVDPPYGTGVAAATVKKLATGPLLKPGGVLVVEHGRREELPDEPGLQLLWSRQMGYTVLSGYRWKG